MAAASGAGARRQSAGRSKPRSTSVGGRGTDLRAYAGAAVTTRASDASRACALLERLARVKRDAPRLARRPPDVRPRARDRRLAMLDGDPPTHSDVEWVAGRSICVAAQPARAVVAAALPGGGRRPHARCWRPFSGWPLGAGLAALFNLAVRGSRRRAAWSVLGARRVSVGDLPAALPRKNDFAYLGRSCSATLVIGVLIALGAVRRAPSATWSRTLHERALRAGGRAGARRRGGARGRAAPDRAARCTTCSPTGSRCCPCTRAPSSSARTPRRRRSPRRRA